MRPGDVIAARFELQVLAGSGGMGAVFRALDRKTGQTVAVKLVRGQHLQAAERFAREAHVLAGLEHPGIVRYVAHGGTTTGDMYLVMEWLDGESLEDRLGHGALSLVDTHALITRTAEALGYAHDRGVVHRDVKPENIFLQGGDVARVKILDFGIARPGRTSRVMTRVGMQLGTPGYMAPEQVRSTTALDARADVFALGCVLYECLTGIPAYAGEHVMALLSKILLEPTPRASEHRPEVPPALDELIARMLSKDPDGRPPHGRAVADALGKIDVRPSASRLSAPGSALTASEQRLLCVVLANTARSGFAVGDDAEAFATLDRTTGAPRGLRGLVEACGGKLERLSDGTVVATVAGSSAATDLAAQAARCALAMRTHLPPEVPIALASGRGAAVGARGPVGAAIDRAAALLVASPGAGGIRMDEMTAGLLDARFEVARGPRGILLRGEHEALDPSRPLLGQATPCVGRERELKTLRTLYEECVTRRRARAVLITAPAGVGKSRLRHEFLRGLAALEVAPEVLIGQGDPMRAGAAFGVLAQALRGAAGIVERDPPGVAQEKLRARIGRRLSGEALDRVSEFIGELLGLGFPDEDRVQLRAARNDPILMGDQMRRAWEELLVAECAARPVVLVLEDLQWGDLPSVTYVDTLLHNLREQAVMVLALARPAVREVFPALWRDHGVFDLRLAGLAPAASRVLVTTALGAKATGKIVDEIVERAGGNAFFLEELVRAAGRGGKDLPETVLAMVQARIEALEPDVRRVLRAASVFGVEFTRDGVAALLGEMPPARLDRCLVALVAEESVKLRDTCAVTAEETYAFRYSLVREAAYGMLTEEDRALGHRLAGAWLERVGAAEATTLAEHFERGARPERAAEWYARAAAMALDGNDFGAVIDRAERGIGCGGSEELRAALRLLQAEAHRWRGQLDEARFCAMEALAGLPVGSRRWYSAVGEMAIAYGKAGEADGVEDLARELAGHTSRGVASEAFGAWIIASARVAMQLLLHRRYELANATLEGLEKQALALDPYDPAVAARLHSARGFQALASGDPVGHLRRLEAAVWSYEQAGDARNACMARVRIGHARAQLGAWSESERALREAFAVAQGAGLENLVDAARAGLIRTLARGGRASEAVALGEQAVVAAGVRGDPKLEGRTRLSLAEARVLEGDLAGAEFEAREAVRLVADLPAFRAFALGRLALVLLAREASADALPVARAGMELADSLGGIDEGDAVVRLAWAEALHANGLFDEALEAIREAQARLEEHAERVRDPAWRARFLSAIPEHARTLELAGEWLKPSSRVSSPPAPPTRTSEAPDEPPSPFTAVEVTRDDVPEVSPESPTIRPPPGAVSWDGLTTAEPTSIEGTEPGAPPTDAPERWGDHTEPFPDR